MPDPNLSPAVVAALEVDPHALGEYMDRDVSATSVKITRAGDGLSKQLEIDPRVLVPGQRYKVLLEGVAGSHTHKLIDKAGTWELVQELRAETVTFVEGDDIEAMIRVAADRVAQAAEAAQGVQRLDGTDAADLEDDSEPVVRPAPEWDDQQ